MSKRKDVTDWKRKESQKITEPSGPKSKSKKTCSKDEKGCCCGGKFIAASLLVSIGVIIGWLAKDFFGSEGFDE